MSLMELVQEKENVPAPQETRVLQVLKKQECDTLQIKRGSDFKKGSIKCPLLPRGTKPKTM